MRDRLGQGRVRIGRDEWTDKGRRNGNARDKWRAMMWRDAGHWDMLNIDMWLSDNRRGGGVAMAMEKEGFFRRERRERERTEGRENRVKRKREEEE